LSRSDEQQTLGLRERKKAKTRAAIQQHALRLFRDQGYPQTTVDQIADAAEVSQSTFFRYFPTKEDVVLYDDYDPQLIAAFHAQPADLSPIEALRGAMRAVLGELPTDELDLERERGALIFAVPALRARFMDQFAATIGMIAELIATRTGRDAEDPLVRNFAGAVIGVALASTQTVVEDPRADYLELLDTGLAHLEAGLPLSHDRLRRSRQ
jgi:AcrR family transcriptional regulator